MRIEKSPGIITAGTKYSGVHIMVDLYGCDFNQINSLEVIREIITRAIEIAGMHPVNEGTFFVFEPQGLSLVIPLGEPRKGIAGVVPLKESHFSIHTSPEAGEALIDIFTCGDEGRPEDALTFLLEKLIYSEVEIMRVYRGRG